MICRLGFHKAAAGAVWNQGYYFSRCERCGCGMIRGSGAWSAVPKGHRIVWRERKRPSPQQPPLPGSNGSFWDRLTAAPRVAESPSPDTDAGFAPRFERAAPRHMRA